MWLTLKSVQRVSFGLYFLFSLVAFFFHEVQNYEDMKVCVLRCCPFIPALQLSSLFFFIHLERFISAFVSFLFKEIDIISLRDYNYNFTENLDKNP